MTSEGVIVQVDHRAAATVVHVSGVVDALASRLNVDDVASDIREAWIDYVEAGGAWTPTPDAVDEKVRGLVHVMLTSPAFHLA